MKKKRYNKQLQQVTLAQCQSRAKKTLGGLQSVASSSYLSGHNDYSDVHPQRVILDIMEAMTPEEYQGWIERLYPEKNA